ncbi:FSR family fosmidomycin resistance protein-like MFS transporter [Rhodobacter viridis]|uniref:FSR family fosmidomycin resistance protein-like MFS transporter n=1 Tax=Rhodobacter viridis TaxID=1054202 RepID=A0A318U8G5_9RHOB|nr:MFS transporter [Rhodobacter viridis]PYF11165.1 FSR family fosmidomycin resistance protein-like MFS transporter [Rhodobacter viridis]
MTAIPQPRAAQATVFPILLAVSACHMMNDVMQSMLSSIYPILKTDFALQYWQIGLMTLAFQGTASLLQPAIGIYTDAKPQPWSLPLASVCTFMGVMGLAFAPSYPALIAAAMLVGLGSAIFHPESSRVARVASGGRFGLAQSVFQVGGNFGTAIGPLLAAFVVLPYGRPSVAIFAGLAVLAGIVLVQVSRWYASHLASRAKKVVDKTLPLSKGRTIAAIAVLVILTFSKNAYMASLHSYYTFYLIESFGVDTRTAQLMLFLFLGAVAAGTVLGGPIADRWGPMVVIWISILGVLPFTLALPHVGLVASGVLTVCIGLILASAFSAIVVLAQELLPGRVGMVAGIFFGLSFGMGGIAAAGLGVLADHVGIRTVYLICSVLPAMGVLTIFLPKRAELIRG